MENQIQKKSNETPIFKINSETAEAAPGVFSFSVVSFLKFP